MFLIHRLEKAFDLIDWPWLLEMLKNNVVNWRKSGLVRNLYMGQRVKLRANQGKTDSVEIERGV
jgi:hypothetical protein